MKRYGSVIGIVPEQIQYYKKLHSDVWPEVLRTIHDCNIRNYTIFIREPENLLFSTFEYVGRDYDADMAKMAADPMTQEWWAVCGPIQLPLQTRARGEWWAEMDEVFHVD